jgi:hypothetical protein
MTTEDPPCDGSGSHSQSAARDAPAAEDPATSVPIGTTIWRLAALSGPCGAMHGKCFFRHLNGPRILGEARCVPGVMADSSVDEVAAQLLQSLIHP